MRAHIKALVLAGLASAGVLAIPGPAGAATNCKTVSCLNKEVKALTKVVTADTRFIGSLANCLSEIPVTQYGNPNGTYGYMYNPGASVGPAYDTTALDITNHGTPVSAWLMYDKCNHTSAAQDHPAADATGGPFGPIAHVTLPADFQPQPKPRP